MLNVALGGS